MTLGAAAKGLFFWRVFSQVRLEKTVTYGYVSRKKVTGVVRRGVGGVARWLDARALGRDPRAHRGGTWADVSENCVKSLHIVSYLQSKSHTLSAPASVGDPYRAPSGGHIRDRRKFAEEVLAKLALASWKAHLEEDGKESAGFGRDLLQRSAPDHGFAHFPRETRAT